MNPAHQDAPPPESSRGGAGGSPAPEEVLDTFGQLFLLAFDGTRLGEDVAEFFRTFRIGGVVLFTDNFRHPEQLGQLTAELQHRCARPGEPLLVATDHEGGRVQRFRTGFTRLPPMAELGTGEPAATEELLAQAGAELAGAGVHLCLAPVADLAAATSAGAVGDRSFGLDPRRTAEHVAAAVRGLRRGGVLSCVKHFPGHGATEVDSHRDLPVVSASRSVMEERELIPFRAALAADVDAVMTAHVRYPQAGADGEAPGEDPPASLSPFWQRQVLRQELGYEGPIVADALEMKALRRYWTPAECGALAFAAGSDLLIYYKEAHQFSAVYRLHRALEQGRLSPTRVAEALGRVRRLKGRLLKMHPELATTPPLQTMKKNAS
ncbi:MAG: beta-N-acetylhexosaminidase [Acidobacteriota bacterium]|nr:beta-N-acetylhexosaminidase [Acidobacteriota bacterium]